MAILHRGHIFHLTGCPKVEEAADALVAIPDGAILVNENGVIEYCGTYIDFAKSRDTPIEIADHSGSFILPGFIDTHLHFPQVYSIDAYGGGQLPEWLNQCIFPAEARLADEAFAEQAARHWCDRLIAAGTTTTLVFGSAFPVAQQALFGEYIRRGLRGVIGRSIQTAGPDAARPLITSETEALKLVCEEIERWHPKSAADAQNALVQVAIIPRFGLSVTPKTLGGLGEIYNDYRGQGVYFTSHLNENNRSVDGEMAEVLRTFQVSNYLDIFDGLFMPGSRKGGESLLGRRSILAHCVHCKDSELKRMAETQSSVSHCPISQQFLGSGTMPWKRTLASGVNISIGSDIAAGDKWFIPDALNCAYKVHISEPCKAGTSLHPAELLHLATVGGARALDLEHRIGNFDSGREADMVIIDPSKWRPLANTLESGFRIDDPQKRTHSLLFTLLMTGNEVAVTETYVRGRRLNSSS